MYDQENDHVTFEEYIFVLICSVSLICFSFQTIDYLSVNSLLSHSVPPVPLQYLDRPGVSYCTRTTYEDNAITNAVEIYTSGRSLLFTCGFYVLLPLTPPLF